MPLDVRKDGQMASPSSMLQPIGCTGRSARARADHWLARIFLCFVPCVFISSYMRCSQSLVLWVPLAMHPPGEVKVQQKYRILLYRSKLPDTLSATYKCRAYVRGPRDREGGGEAGHRRGEESLVI